MKCNMSVDFQNSQPATQERFVYSALRSWLNTIAPVTIGELNAKIQTLARPARNLIAKSGGILEFVKRCPELTVADDRLEISLNSPVTYTEELDSSEVSARLSRLSKEEIDDLNRRLTKFHVGPRSSSLVTAFQKRERLVELKHQCETKRSDIETLKKQVAARSSEDSLDVNERLKELQSVRDAALERLSEKEVILEKRNRLEKLLIRLDKEIESREEKLGKLKLKVLYDRERLAMLEQDLFFGSRQHESLTNEYLQQHSSDLEKLSTIFEVLVREKSNHSKLVLNAFIDALEASRQSESLTARSCRRSMAAIEKREEEFLSRIRERRIDLQMISQFDLITIDSIKSLPVGEKVVEVEPAETAPPAEESPLGNPEQQPTGTTEGAMCAICLTDLTSGESEKLECTHDFHSSCLAGMYSHGKSHCPLCRRYEPSSTDFPTL